MKLVCTLTAVVAAAALSAAPAHARVSQHKPLRQMTLQERYRYQQQVIRHDRSVIRWWQNHPRAWPVRFLADTPRPTMAPYPLWFAEKQLGWTLRELAETKGLMTARAAWPPHRALWDCIHPREASDWHNHDTGGNGHYGGLQLHPGWGYGSSYYASDDSPQQQEWAAERAYRASGYSRAWVLGQWAQTIEPCWRYAT